MAVLAEEIDALNAKKGAVPGLELVTKPLPTDKKSRKRAREVATRSSSEESSDSSSSDEMDLGSGRLSSSDSEDLPRRKKKTGKKGKKLSAKLTSKSHWRRQAKTLGGNGQAEMKVLL